MKNNISEKIKSLKEAVVSIFDENLDGLKKKELFEDIKGLPLYHINNIFESIADKLVGDDKKNRGILRAYVNTIREDKEMRRQYWFNHGLQNAFNRGVSDGNLFLNEMLKYKTDKSNNISVLGGVVCEAIDSLGFSTIEIEELINNTKNPVLESAEYVYCNNSFKDVATYTDNLKTITESLKAPEGKKEVKEGKATYNDLKAIVENEMLKPWESAVIKDIASSTLKDNGYKSLFESYKQDCMNTINEMIEDTSIESYSQLVEMKNGLEGKTFNEETVREDLFNLAELKNTLKQ